MRRSFLWALLGVAAAAVVLLGRPSVPGVTPPSPSRHPLSLPAAVPAGPLDSVSSPASLRNVFQYLDEPAAPAASLLPPLAASPPPALQPSPSPAVRLVGLVRRGDRLRAALWIAGEVVVLAAGEEAEGYHLLSVSEDQGVRLRAPSGEDLTLPPPGE